MAAAYIAIISLGISSRNEMSLVEDHLLLVEQVAALMTAISAAAAAFATVIPGRRRSVVALPVMSFGIWIATVVSALPAGEWMAVKTALVAQTDWRCAATIALSAAMPAVSLAAALRRGAPLMPGVTAMLAGLAAAAVGTFAVCGFRPREPNAVVLIWHCGTVLLLAVASTFVGRYFLKWPHVPHG
jgi:hypothetical protein